MGDNARSAFARTLAAVLAGGRPLDCAALQRAIKLRVRPSSLFGPCLRQSSHVFVNSRRSRDRERRRSLPAVTPCKTSPGVRFPFGLSATTHVFLSVRLPLPRFIDTPQDRTRRVHRLLTDVRIFHGIANDAGRIPHPAPAWSMGVLVPSSAVCAAFPSHCCYTLSTWPRIRPLRRSRSRTSPTKSPRPARGPAFAAPIRSLARYESAEASHGARANRRSRR